MTPSRRNPIIDIATVVADPSPKFAIRRTESNRSPSCKRSQADSQFVRHFMWSHEAGRARFGVVVNRGDRVCHLLASHVVGSPQNAETPHSVNALHCPFIAPSSGAFCVIRRKKMKLSALTSPTVVFARFTLSSFFHFSFKIGHPVPC
jgi:hypothetical protein